MSNTNTSFQSASTVYDKIAEQFFLRYREVLLNQAGHIDLPNEEDRTRVAANSLLQAAIAIAVEHINRREYDENAIDALSEFIATLTLSDKEATKSLLTHIRDTEDAMRNSDTAE